ncbi:hypothetical protein CLROS_013320 [Clostridium felsineum]|uniref:Uncharacterized protein n=2 Tax=Clostridium felsineum TaxID=36839 RepID=A0A1S8MB70_9CLOT|nr:DUF3862 domain-containing protein [Clostridium felsineum]URZ06000.1 hypothetical protein CLROS_013320 [Clostridium felsineum]URZ11037.1 hypothetical protein CROST_017530 [Clostridium felsineum]
MKIVILILVLIAIIVIFCFKLNVYNSNNTKMSKNKKTDIANSKPKKKAASNKIAFDSDKFLKIREGMNYNDVKAILGNGEKIKVQKPVDWINGYRWLNADKSYIEVDFRNNIISAKYLSYIDTSMNAKVSQKDFNKLSIGMTYDDVVKILGPGRLCTEHYGNNHGQAYSWINHDGSTISIILQNGKITGKGTSDLN